MTMFYTDIFNLLKACVNLDNGEKVCLEEPSKVRSCSVVQCFALGSPINDVFSKGEGGGHKIGKMGRRRLWMTPNENSIRESLKLLQLRLQWFVEFKWYF